MDCFCFFLFNVTPPQMISPESRSPLNKCICSTLRTLKLHLIKSVSVDFTILAVSWDCLQQAMAATLRGALNSSYTAHFPPLLFYNLSLPLEFKTPYNECKNSHLYFFNLLGGNVYPVLWCICRGQKTTCRSQFSPTMWSLGMDLGS